MEATQAHSHDLVLGVSDHTYTNPMAPWLLLDHKALLMGVKIRGPSHGISTSRGLYVRGGGSYWDIFQKKKQIWEDFCAFEWPGVMKSQPPWGYQSYPYVSEYCCTLGTSSYLLLNHGHTLQNCDSKNVFYFAQYHLIYTPVNYLTFMPKAFIATERVRNLFDKFPVVNWGIICSRPPDNPSQIAGVASRFAQQGHHQCYLTERPTLWEWCSRGGWRGGGEVIGRKPLFYSIPLQDIFCIISLYIWIVELHADLEFFQESWIVVMAMCLMQEKIWGTHKRIYILI